MALEATIPTRNALQALLDNAENNPAFKKLVEDQIKQYKLPYMIEGLKLVDVAESTEAWLDRFITQDERMLQMKEDVRKLANVKDEVLIYGPTGTGKEIIARALHGKAESPFLAVNCAGFPEQLVESLLFGHLKGSFTGADEDRKGYMQAAKDGTFFLDEVGELPIQLQGKFLRALQERKILRIGSNKSEPISCRIVCASNKSIPKMCEEGKFRLDLYARLSTFEIDVTGLDERTKDIFLILQNINSDGLTKEDGANFIKAWLNAHPDRTIDDISVPLNVRSLQQYVKRYKVLGRLP